MLQVQRKSARNKALFLDSQQNSEKNNKTKDTI